MTIIHAHAAPYHRPLGCGPCRARIRTSKSTADADRFCPVHGYYPAWLGTCPRCH